MAEPPKKAEVAPDFLILSFTFRELFNGLELTLGYKHQIRNHSHGHVAPGGKLPCQTGTSNWAGGRLRVPP